MAPRTRPPAPRSGAPTSAAATFSLLLFLSSSPSPSRSINFEIASSSAFQNVLRSETAAAAPRRRRIFVSDGPGAVAPPAVGGASSSFAARRNRSDKASRSAFGRRRYSTAEDGAGDGDSTIDLKAELTAYLAKREEMNADEAAKSEVGRVVGGTKGNKILEYVSGAPNKEIVIEEEPNVFDYDELGKYGFGHLVTPIMNSGGRRAMYDLMDMTPPAVPDRAKPKSAPKLVIDRTGETDDARYKGLKLGQVLDDDEMGRALAEVQRKKQEGESLRKKLVEEEYVQPFADKRNVGPAQTPNWTPERLDEEGRKRGEAIAWARRAKAGEYRSDPDENVIVDGPLRLYCVLTSLFVAFAFGKSSPAALSILGYGGDPNGLLDALRGPAFAIVLASLASGLISSIAIAPTKNRSSTVWAVKGFAGGPLAILRLRGLDELRVRGEEE